MARIILFSYDRAIDRRSLLQAETLIARGHDVTLYAQENGQASQDAPYIRRVGNAPGEACSNHAFRVLDWRYRLEKMVPGLFRVVLPVLRPLYWMLTGCNPTSLYLALYKHALDTMAPADIYIAHDLPMLPVAVAAKERFGGKVIYDSHELFCGQEFSALEIRMWQKTERDTIGKADAVITVNPSIAAELEKTYGVKAGVIYNAEALPEGAPAQQKRFHTHFGLPDNVRIVLYQGGLSHGRNIDMLVRAMRAMPQDVHLVVLGCGPALASLKAIAEKEGTAARVHFHDAVPQAQLLDYTASADLGVIPYRDTCLNYRYCTPNKLFEFIAAGIPIVATDLPEISRMLREHGIGMVGNTGNTQTFSALLRSALEPAALATLRNNVLEARKTINWQHEGVRFIEAVEAVL